MTLKLGSRKSRLALWQTNHIADLLRRAHPDLDVDIVTMDTTGDRRRDEPLPQIGAKGLFTAELERALLDDSIDVAVHSLKDLPSALPEGLKYAGSPTRAAATDAFISTRWSGVDDLPDKATIATGSQRRRAQLLARRPDLQLTDLRGNIGTRLKKLDDHGYDGIIMATAALHRLEMNEVITTELDPSRHVPAVGQGAIGLETRQGRSDIADILAPILDKETTTAVQAERIFMARLEGGCSVALGAYCHPQPDPLAPWNLCAFASSTDGQQVIYRQATGDDPAAMAHAMVDEFLEAGARQILHA